MLDLESLKAEFPKFQGWQDLSTDSMPKFSATLEGDRIRFWLEVYFKPNIWSAVVIVDDPFWHTLLEGEGKTLEDAILDLKSKVREVSKVFGLDLGDRIQQIYNQKHWIKIISPFDQEEDYRADICPFSTSGFNGRGDYCGRGATPEEALDRAIADFSKGEMSPDQTERASYIDMLWQLIAKAKECSSADPSLLEMCDRFSETILRTLPH